MNPKRKLKLICLRHAVLDISEDFLELCSQWDEMPEYLKGETREIQEELKLVQPRFHSHRKTSPLFDREGMGQKGLQKAKDLARRIIAVYRSSEKGDLENE